MALETFLETIKEIKSLINGIFIEEEFISQVNCMHSESLNKYVKSKKDFIRKKKVYDYKSIVVSLYGALEHFINQLIEEHILNINSIVPSYENLDKTLKSEHFRLSIQLINTIIDSRYAKYSHLEKEDVLKKLNECVTNPLNYMLNKDAFLPSSGNLKHAKVMDALKIFDININSSIKNQQEFSDYLKEKYDKSYSNVEDSIIYEKIDDLVNRRNEIAHDSHIQDILQPIMYDDYITLLVHYCKSIDAIIKAKEYEYTINHKCFKIDNIIDVFNSSVLAFNIPNNEYNLKVGNFLYIHTAQNAYQKKIIKTIQINSKNKEKITNFANENIAIGVNKTIKKNAQFYLLN